MPSAGASASPPERPTLFVDRNSGDRSFKAMLESAGVPVVLHDDVFQRTATDEEWITGVGKKGWIAVTGDNAITRDPLAVHHLSRSKLHLFVLLGLNGVAPSAKAESITRAYDKMAELARSHAPPGIWRIGRDGVARAFDFRKILTRMQRRR